MKEQINQNLSSISDLEDDLLNTKQQLRESQDKQSSLEDQATAKREQCEAALHEKHKAEEALRDVGSILKMTRTLLIRS